MDDLDPPSFQFRRGRRERDPEETLLPDPVATLQATERTMALVKVSP